MCNNRIKDLFTSLVGSSVEFSFKKKLEDATSIEKNILSARKRIERDVENALSVGGELCVMLLSELTAFYRGEPYYMAVRGSIEMRRYRPAVLEYMSMAPDKRAKRLKTLLSGKYTFDKNRDLKVTALGYFLSTYPSRLGEFKGLLTREEYMLVA